MALKNLRVLAPVAVLVALAACDPSPPDPVTGSGTTPPAVGTTPSAAGTTGATDVTPSPDRASPTRGAVSAAPTATRAACPVSAATLQKVAGLDVKTHRIDPDHINCARQWATAGVIAVDPGQQGDGLLVFAHSAGRWQKIGEGSGLECSPYGIPEEIGDQLGCRDHS
ncbi:hypothetical protein [Micromonospora antibiotica]|uniref:Lipoprotein n=1 Tax=Micromonospora antibiotica TaxID=2807623 RepID=A0ABS3VC55_9ACTN|nr:hypothetical protein [Micromonospora antibiotica]MBO4163213.1 hypothetical protein [Micromonospora antibiotica]